MVPSIIKHLQFKIPRSEMLSVGCRAKYVLWYLKPPASAKSLMMRQRSTCQLGSKVRARVGRRRLVQFFLRQKTVL